MKPPSDENEQPPAETDETSLPEPLEDLGEAQSPTDLGEAQGPPDLGKTSLSPEPVAAGLAADEEEEWKTVGSRSHKSKVSGPLLPQNLPRSLDPEGIPRRPYRRRSDAEKIVKHWGQRKLCLSEIEFLTDYLPEPSQRLRTTVVYAGAAPGTHITMLVDLFPQVHRWILIDPVRFGLADHPRVEKRRELFTDELAISLRQRLDYEALEATKNGPVPLGRSGPAPLGRSGPVPLGRSGPAPLGRSGPVPLGRSGPGSSDSIRPWVLFISDIRTANWKLMSRKENEHQIEMDNIDQMRWCQILRPDKAMLKFRLPYGQGTTYYLPGEIRFQVWAPPSSTETRLIPYTGSGTRYQDTIPYEHMDYEERLFYFNTQVRMAERFPHGVKGPGLDYQYDSAAEVLILARYLERFASGAEADGTSHAADTCRKGQSQGEGHEHKDQGEDRAEETELLRKRIVSLSKSLSHLIGQGDGDLAGRLPESARRGRINYYECDK